MKMPRLTATNIPPPPVPSSPTTPDSGVQTARSPFRWNFRKSSFPPPAVPQDDTQSATKRPATAHASSSEIYSQASTGVTALPPLPNPSFPRPTTGHSSSPTHRPSRLLFPNMKASKSSLNLDTDSTTVRKVEVDAEVEPGNDTWTGRPRPRSGSHPETSTPSLLTDIETKSVRSEGDQSTATPLPSQADPYEKPSVGQSSQEVLPQDEPVSGRKGRRFFMGRARSIRADPDSGSSRFTNRNHSADNKTPSRKGSAADMPGLKTAPLGSERDRSFGNMFNSSARNRSLDRAAESEDDGAPTAKNAKNEKKIPSTSFSTSHSNGSALFAAVRKGSQAAADGFNGLYRAGNGIKKKMKRSESVTTKEDFLPVDEQYVFKVINLPLAEQTRITRIGKRLELSKDKTEFWLPALPWRCIDYLNSKGCEEEGIYRISGSSAQIKHWQRRFDTELDIDLFEEKELYDINIVASMFKQWLRQLPDEVLPSTVQNKIGKICSEHDQSQVPQILKDELSLLPPFNYYLLFAITCHLSLLQSYSDQNKMTFTNLCICFQPCMKVEMPIFHFLVKNWKQCWQGCWTEEAYLNEEYRILDGHPAASPALPIRNSSVLLDERAVSSSDSKSTSSSSNVPKADKGGVAPLSPTRSASSSHTTADSAGASNTSTLTPRFYTNGTAQLPELELLEPFAPVL